MAIEGEKSGPRTGPKIPTGLMVESSTPSPSFATNSHAARSVMVFDFTTKVHV